ncbi:hypothetical protein CC80DRAFT_491747 [Byssothecium circinans]|uniref:Uncharacterized protein n=1 Tax=Byssothecium circinans TaxID=147558 RepID=A0A6A5TW53_9PLEO|nr:hypothetical protein CC80DRAFT_491747 [Byssothecium circinans]
MNVPRWTRPPGLTINVSHSPPAWFPSLACLGLDYFIFSYAIGLTFVFLIVPFSLVTFDYCSG